jgi:uncharacterized membrane protein
MAGGAATIREGEEAAGGNSLGRLLALSDGVFAIAMTLLALDLRLPDLPAHITDAELRHALVDPWRSYLSFVISFYVVANYWGVHRRALRNVATADRGLIGSTLLVLLLVAAVPFPASVLGNYGGRPSALAFYSAFNVVIALALLRLLRGLGPQEPGGRREATEERVGLWADIVVLLVCIPGAYLLGDNGPFLLLLLGVSGRVAPLVARRIS